MSVAEVTAWPAQLPDHLSASQLAKFARCPEEYRQRYLLHRAERTGAAMLLGRVDHKAHEHNFRQKIDSRHDVPVREVEEKFASLYDEEIDKAGGESEIAWGDDNLSRIKDEGVRLVRAYHEQVSPLIQPVAVEEDFAYRIPGLSVPIIGKIDLRAEQRGIIERKTTQQAVSQPKGQWRIQAMVYRTMHAAPVEWHLSVRTATPQIITPESPPPAKAKKGHAGFGGLRLPYTPGCEDLANRYIGRILRNLHATFLMFGPDEAWPGAMDHPWACGSCAHRSACPWWQS